VNRSLAALYSVYHYRPVNADETVQLNSAHSCTSLYVIEFKSRRICVLWEFEYVIGVIIRLGSMLVDSRRNKESSLPSIEKVKLCLAWIWMCAHPIGRFCHVLCCHWLPREEPDT